MEFRTVLYGNKALKKEFVFYQKSYIGRSFSVAFQVRRDEFNELIFASFSLLDLRFQP